MNKDFTKEKLLSMSVQKQLKALYDLASFVEDNHCDMTSTHFLKLQKYHDFLQQSLQENIQKLNKEFKKIKDINYQFQVYLMNLERLLGQSKKEYLFMVDTGDKQSSIVKNQKFPVVCILDSIRSAHNVGSMFRNAECFGVQELILCGLSPTADSLHVQKTAMGCETEVAWKYSKNACDEVQRLKNAGYTIWSIETSPSAVEINSIAKFPTPLALIFGHEQFGVSKELLDLSDQIVSIKLFGSKNSLNVGISQAIILNQISTKMTQAN